jgi:aminodeoxychorismate synthase component I
VASAAPTPPVHVACRLGAPRPAPGLLGAFASLRRGAYPWLLDSALPGGRLGRFSFAGAEPWAVLRARGRALELDVRRRVHPAWRVGTHRRTGDPLAWLRELAPRLDAAPEPDAPPFVGGAVGWFGYELAEQLEPVRLPAAEGAPFADVTFLLVDALLAWDHATGTLRSCALGFDRDPAAAGRAAARALARIEAHGGRRPARTPRPRPPRELGVEARHSPEDYEGLVDVILGAIGEGDLYQACLTHRIDVGPVGDDPWALYERLRDGNPAPFAAYLALPEGAVLSSSPERFLRLGADGSVEARPIKGTREVGDDADASRAALAASEKDRAENVMITDLYRNDLGRVCETGSVDVPELCAIERYGRLHQMVSTVTGRLAPGRDRFDLVRAAFPPGSMTGAPKIAAMRLLAELEPVRRGVYSGALGYLDARGGMDLSVVIRTVLVCDGRAHVHVGGGIVADSTPAAEYRETLDKARPLLAALGTTPSAAAGHAASAGRVDPETPGARAGGPAPTPGVRP